MATKTQKTKLMKAQDNQFSRFILDSPKEVHDWFLKRKNALIAGEECDYPTLDALHYDYINLLTRAKSNRPNAESKMLLKAIVKEKVDEITADLEARIAEHQADNEVEVSEETESE